ncbi:alpha/beta hydrolase, partial [Klebsiella pneumoniae]|nr:alpha/beta hydrolase [Klebsiella pneumoniae]
MDKHGTAILTGLIIPSAFAHTPLIESTTIVINPSALAVEMVPDIAYSFTQNIMGRPLQLTMDLLKLYAD